MKEHLSILEHDYVFRIGWYFPDEWEYEAMLGERALGSKPDRANDPAGWEMWAADETARKTPGVEKDSTCFFWETRAQARGALALIRAVLRSSRPLVAWEKKALAAGWKPPRKL